MGWRGECVSNFLLPDDLGELERTWERFLSGDGDE